jgi:hypothetical protein
VGLSDGSEHFNNGEDMRKVFCVVTGDESTEVILVEVIG